MRKTVHIISHSHWDREWYLPFEQHRLKLVELIDTTLELFRQDPDFKKFHLDGQTILLDDYLQIRPQGRAALLQAIQNGQLHIGPWYILQDEFLTSGESNVRNLLVGIQEAGAYGRPCLLGYFPDAFGNAGQMPQLLSQAGMRAVAFGRGVKPVGFDNQMLGGDYESAYSEMMWQSPDGSALLGIFFANWYNNGAEIPAEPAAAKKFWDKGLADAERYAATSQLLFMNGCDHQPVQKNLSAAIETARKLYPDIAFIHSDFETYIKAVEAELPADLSCVQGELTSQETDGFWTLVNTTSAHVDLKVQNRIGETALEGKAEPMAVLAALQGKPYPRDQLRYGWKTLMQNHPHDSICGCSVDEVNREMAARFAKSRQVADALYIESRDWLAEQINTAALPETAQMPFAVFNTTGWPRTGVVRVVLDVEHSLEGGFTKAYDALKAKALPTYRVKDAAGHTVDAVIEDLGVNFGYTLPDDRFRQPYMARQIAVTLNAEEIPAFGYAVYYLEEGAPAEGTGLVTGPRTMENAKLKVEIAPDGSYDLTEKATGRCYQGLGWFEDTGDIGNEYIYVQAKNSAALTTRGLPAAIRLAEDTPCRAVFEITHTLAIPTGADETFAEEKRRMVGLFDRQAGRSAETVPLKLTTRLTLEKCAAALQVETTVDNTAKDHRLRVVFPTGLDAAGHCADSMFEVVRRPNRHGAAWKNPSACEHQQNFVSMQDAAGGLTVANFGLYEYEVLPDDSNAIAVTLLRAVSEMGDWGVFPTPDAQMQGRYTLRYAVMPFAPGKETDAWREAYQFQTGLDGCQIAQHAGPLPLKDGLLTWEGEGLHLTGLKQAEEGSDVMVRFVNNNANPVTLKLARRNWMRGAYKSNVLEEKIGELIPTEQGWELELRPFEIATVGLTV